MELIVLFVHLHELDRLHQSMMSGQFPVLVGNIGIGLVVLFVRSHA